MTHTLIQFIANAKKNTRVVNKKALSRIIGKLNFLNLAIPFGHLYLSNLYIDLE